MDPLTYFIVWVGTMILASLLRDKPDFDPASAEDLNLPVVSQSHKIPLVIGQGLLTGANSLDTGTLGTKALKVSAGLFGGSQETGVFRYYLDEFFGLAYGPGELLGIQMGDYDLGITPATATGEQFIEKRKLWGDDDSPGGGGFVGYVRFNAGVEAGVIDSVVEARTGNIQPGYPNVATVLLYNDSKRGGAYRGNQVPFKPVKFHYGYYPNPLSHGSNHKINGHANVAYFLHDLSKDPLWGRDIGGALDLTAISDMAATLAAEGLGWSRTFYSGDAANMEREALDYVDAVRYRAPGSGLVTYGLIRDDFDVGNLRVLGDADITEGGMVIEAGSLSVAATEVTITYVDVAEGFKRKTITRPNPAARQMLGRRGPVAMEFLGCPDGATADKIATREALKLSVPQRKGKLWATREAWDLANGEAIVVNYTPEKITGMIVRVASINRGNITDTDGRVEIDWVEVPFNYGPGVFGDVGSNPATPLAGAPADVTAYHAFELPDFLTDSPHKLGIFAVDPVGHSYGYDLQIAPQSAGNWFTDSLGQFADPFTISTNYSEQATTIILDGEIESIADHGWADISANGYNLVLLDTANGEEWIAYEDGSYNAGLDQTTLIGVRRGLLDTYPKALISTDDAWLLDEAAVSSHTFGATDNADFRLLDKTAQGTLAEGSATVREHLFTNRHTRPFLPGNIQLNSNLFPAAVTGPVTASWAHRDKTAGALRDWFDATGYGPEAGVTYKVEWYNDDTSALLKSTTGITGTSDNWNDDGESYNVRLEITAQRGGIDSHETFVHVAAFSQPTNAFSRVKLLLHMDGTDGSTTFTDHSNSAHTVTAVGDAQIDTAQSKYGGASGLFDGTGDHLSIPYVSGEFNWNAEDYTIEMWVRASSFSDWSNSGFDIPMAIGQQQATGSSSWWSFGPMDDGKLQFYYFNGGLVHVESTGTIPVDTWTHIAMTYTNSTNSIALFIAGVEDGGATVSGVPQFSSSPLVLGQFNSQSITGWIDDVRITRGEVLYTGNFTPPTAAHPDS